AYTVDAACASSLLAVQQCCELLTSHAADIMLCGGIHLWQDESLWWAFQNLRAFSASGRARPFDRSADGLLLGEGAGFFTLKRESDALRDGDRILAIIRGWGASSDPVGDGVLAPSPSGQADAMARAWERAGRDPAEIAYLEAHGTGTPAGDHVELAALRKIFADADARRARIGAVKGLIGHSMAAAGAAGLAKLVLGISRSWMPPTGNIEEPSDELLGTSFRPVDAPEPWGSSCPVGAVSAFGFGGVNVHLVVTGKDAPSRASRVQRYAAPTFDGLAAALRERRQEGTGACRAVVVEEGEKRRLLAANAAAANRTLRSSRAGLSVVVGDAPRAPGKVAFLFPGLDAVQRGGTVATPGAPDPTRFGIDVVAQGIREWRLLSNAGVKPDVVAGHSIGEWAAMTAAGLVSDAEARAVLRRIRPGYFDFPDVGFLAVNAGVATVRQLFDAVGELELSHDNCPGQTVICGSPERLHEAEEWLRAGRRPAWHLPFRTGFHTSHMVGRLNRHTATIDEMSLSAPLVPIFSATTVSEYPKDQDGVRALLSEQLVKPVRFRELVELLFERGVRVFVQMGQGGLAAFVEDTLRGRDCLVTSTTDAGESERDKVDWMRALLWADGVDPVRVCRGTARPRVEAVVELGVPTFAEPDPDAAPPDDRPDPHDTPRFLDVSLSEYPELRDHAFVRQPDGWTDVSDRDPAVPFSGLIELFRRTLSSLGRGAIGRLTNVSAQTMMRVAQPVSVPITLSREEDGMTVRFGDYARATGEWRHGSAFRRGPEPESIRPSPVSAAELYERRFMFHGPEYRTVRSVDGVAANAVRGSVVVSDALGATLDGAAQLLGLWVMLQADVDRLTIPVRAREVEFYSASPRPGQIADCLVRVSKLGVRSVVADLELSVDGEPWLRVEGWEDLRLDLPERLWNVIRWPDRYMCALPVRASAVEMDDAYRTPVIEHHFLRLYLSAAERASVSTSGELDWNEVTKLIAAKDAVRSLLWDTMAGPIFPVEVVLESRVPERYVLACSGKRFCAVVRRDGEKYVAASSTSPVAEPSDRGAFVSP
ncbi:MAG TPA: beta-ketoacyl synthase N-terminal-like domain-containing protein, partial [Polyangiaceae bacterium]|nr:beta-ketoacyl synthase N-terminal-like domain-containing protein [Polyangiaceae bacterium]